MIPVLEKIDVSQNYSFVAKEVVKNAPQSLEEAWHFHPHIELCFTSKSIGRRFVGNNISNYSEGDLILCGSHLPHGFVMPENSVQLVIQFCPKFLGDDFFLTPELKHVNEMLERSKSVSYTHLTLPTTPYV